MNPLFLLFIVFAGLLAVNGVRAFRSSKPANGVVSFVAAVAVVLIGNYLVNF